ncbi:hypothetical protein ACVDG8_007005 [Mesorhizobium sp. ORM8.1]
MVQTFTGSASAGTDKTKAGTDKTSAGTVKNKSGRTARQAVPGVKSKRFKGKPDGSSMRMRQVLPITKPSNN